MQVLQYINMKIIPKEKKQQIRRLVKSKFPYSLRQIAKIAGVSYTTVANYKKAWSVK